MKDIIAGAHKARYTVGENDDETSDKHLFGMEGGAAEAPLSFESVIVAHTCRETWYWYFLDEGVGEVAQTAKKKREEKFGKATLGTQRSQYRRIKLRWGTE